MGTSVNELSVAGVSYFILVCSDGSDVDDRKVFAKDIADSRIGVGEWPLYKDTPHKGSIKPGDHVLIYLAGSGLHAQCFVGTAKVSSVAVAKRGWQEPLSNLVADPAILMISLEGIVMWGRPVSIREHLKDLEFVKSKRFWGVSLMGGVKQISVRDFELISHP